MDKDVEDARKLANKFVAACMESPLPLEICMTVMAHVLVDFALTNEAPLEVLLSDMERMYQINKLVKAEPSGAMH